LSAGNDEGGHLDLRIAAARDVCGDRPVLFGSEAFALDLAMDGPE